MKQTQFSARRRQLMAIGGIGAGALAAPAMVMAATEPSVHFAGEKVVVSGRVVDAQEGRALAGAQIEIWQADARGVRDERTLEVITADGDGRYFAVLPVDGNKVQRLHYRVSRQGYTAKVTQIVANARQRSVTLTRDHQGATRAACEITLSPRKAPAGSAAVAPDYVAL
jgi:Dioxygenase